jgi:predicted nucleotidyltransferase component of viral defense system
LRKCYFPGYRFSEDLDFTAIRYITSEELSEWVTQIAAWSSDHAGPDFLAAPYRLEIVEDEYGKEYLQLRVYYRGPLRWGGSPRAIRIDVTRNERLIWAGEERHLFHAYSDAGDLGNSTIFCYALLEVLAEKIRALCGQRRFAISRDVYDVYRLINSGVNIGDIASNLHEKFKVRGVDINTLSVTTLEQRRSEFEQSWIKQLSYLIPEPQNRIQWTRSPFCLRDRGKKNSPLDGKSKIGTACLYATGHIFVDSTFKISIQETFFILRPMDKGEMVGSWS